LSKFGNVFLMAAECRVSAQCPTQAQQYTHIMVVSNVVLGKWLSDEEGTVFKLNIHHSVTRRCSAA